MYNNSIMKKFYITGISGVGKSSVSELLNERGIFSIDIDAVKGLCHWRNKKTFEKAHWYSGIGEEWLEAHDWICDTEKLIQLLDQDKDIIVVVGNSSNQQGYLDLFDKVFILRCSPETFTDRINNRTNNDYGKHEIEQKRILSWYKNFEDRLIKQGAIPINTEESLDIIVDRIVGYIKF